MKRWNWRDKLGLAADSLSVLQFVFSWDGFWAFVLALLQSWAAGLLDAPRWAVTPLAIFTFASVLFLFNQAQVLRDRRARLAGAPDYRLWDEQQDFSVWDAACLWDEKPLTSQVLSERGLHIMRRIKDAINQGRIGATNLGPAGANKASRVTREQLRALAGALAGMWGERPKFLYPDAR